MLVVKKQKGYSSKRKFVQGKGFVDSLSSAFNSFKTIALPALKSVTSYVKQNKDLIAKPALSALGDLGAMGITLAGKKIIKHLLKDESGNENSNAKDAAAPQLDTKSREILQSIMRNETPVTNIIGSGIKQF